MADQELPGPHPPRDEICSSTVMTKGPGGNCDEKGMGELNSDLEDAKAAEQETEGPEEWQEVARQSETVEIQSGFTISRTVSSTFKEVSSGRRMKLVFDHSLSDTE